MADAALANTNHTSATTLEKFYVHKLKAKGGETIDATSARKERPDTPAQVLRWENIGNVSDVSSD